MQIPVTCYRMETFLKTFLDACEKLCVCHFSGNLRIFPTTKLSSFLSDWLSDDFNFISKSQQPNGNNELIAAFD